ncbi:MAG TPA: AraC family transcriptional regulator [Verrucomicrobiota bacterium]|nr:AraC family transcriptional regulator [Verrucomicrobiota bacterium]
MVFNLDYCSEMKDVNTTYLMRASETNGSETVDNSETDVADRVARSIAYMSRHLNQPLQVSVLAAQANVSASHYFALFKRCTGCAPIDYFTRMRIQRACELIETTELSVKAVATELGYDDPFYFSRVFKSVTGIAPSDFRKAEKAGNSRDNRSGYGQSLVVRNDNDQTEALGEGFRDKFSFLRRSRLGAAWKSVVSPMVA